MLQGAGRGARRSRADLHADDRRGGVRDARLRAHRRDPLGRLRRLCRGEPRDADRRRDAESDGHLGCRNARRQAGSATSTWSTRRCGSPRNPPRKVIIVNRGLDHAMAVVAGRDLDYATLRARHDGRARCHANGSNRRSRRTSSTRRARPASRRASSATPAATRSRSRRRCGSIFCVEPGETMFTTSDIGWVVGHSYIVYAPLINGSTTIMYEGLPIRPDPAIWWKIVAENKVRRMFSSPTAIRVLKKQDPAYMKQHDLSALKYLFLAGEPLDEPTARWAADSLGVAIVDNYWQTETGWPILSAQPGIEDTPRKFGSPSFAVYGYDVRAAARRHGRRSGRRRKGRADDHSAAAARLHDDGLGRRRALREDLFLGLRQEARVFDVRLGDARSRRLLLRARPHRRRDQRRRPSARHARDRGGRAGASGNRRRWRWSASPMRSRARFRWRSPS